MKEFDLEAAKNGAAVCTRDGRPARIICYDAKGGGYPIIVLIDDGGIENPVDVNENGEYFEGCEDEDDLFMAD